MKICLSVLFSLLSLSTAIGQYQIGLIPRVSPDKETMQRIGYTEIRIAYGSPSVSGREVWGGIVPYDKVWRAGANNATTIYFNQDVIIEGKPLAQGEYAFFVIPSKKYKWTCIFNKIDRQWGAFNYDQAEDALRVEVSPRTVNYLEQLTYTIDHYSFDFGLITMAWDNMAIDIEVKTEYLNVLKSEVETRADNADANIKWVVYLQGAEYLLDKNTSLDLAKEWIRKSESDSNLIEEWNDQYYPQAYTKGHLQWLKARLAAIEERYSDAVELANDLISNEELNSFYLEERITSGIDVTIDNWKKRI